VTWFNEELYTRVVDHGYRQSFRVLREIARLKTEFQEMAIFDTPYFGRVLALDGVIQATERDEFVYHEMMAHVPLFAHGAARNVLIIGGGDGGVLREVLRHPVERATMVEIDGGVVDFCREHMPGLNAGAFDDPRTELLIADGIRYVAESERRFDVILIDSTDPVGPGEALFTDAFYADCKRRLTPGGVLVTQGGVPFFQPDEIRDIRRRLQPLFRDSGCYLIAVPTYVGGLMALGWATDDVSLREVPDSTLAERCRAAGFATRYYAPGVHRAAFRLPPFVGTLLD
jgi:spermidine synthase